MGVLGAAVALLGITVLRITDYPSNSLRTFTLLDTGLYGWLTLGVLVCGFLLIYPRERYSAAARFLRTLPNQLRRSMVHSKQRHFTRVKP